MCFSSITIDSVEGSLSVLILNPYIEMFSTKRVDVLNELKGRFTSFVKTNTASGLVKRL